MTVAEEQLVAPVASSILYLSRRIDLWLVKTPRYNIMYPSGQREVGGLVGERLEFRQGRLDVPISGPIVLADGRKVDGEAADDIRKWLDDHRLNGDVEGGFWRVDPTAPAVSEEEFSRVTDATLDLNADVLREIVAQEEAGWNRDTLLNVARRQIDKIEALRVEMEAQREEAEAEAAKSKPGPKPKAG